MTALQDTPSEQFARCVWQLRDGYGVEDIAVKEGVSVDDIRDLVVALRRTGMLRKLLKV